MFLRLEIRNFQRIRLEVFAVSWVRDSHGLFDYECKSIVENKMTTNTNGKQPEFPKKFIFFSQPFWSELKMTFIWLQKM
jgi:hypothetical protein